MKRITGLLALVALVGFSAPVLADVIDTGGLTIEASYAIDQPSIGVRAVDPLSAYSNVTTFSGSAVTPAGATGTSGTRVTAMVGDDCNFISGAAGNNITTLRFSVANFNSAAFSANSMVRFYSDNSNSPGSFLAGFNFNALSFPALSVSVVTFNIPVANQWAVPAGGKMWAGEAFYITTGTGTATTSLNNMGLGIYNPVDKGTSADEDFVSATSGGTNTSAFVVNNPAGSVRNSPFTANPVANYGWEFNAAPEPASLCLLALGSLALIRRRR